MRDCPVCGSAKRTELQKQYASKEWVLYRCQCNMLYVDAPLATEQSVGDYYRNVYKTDDEPYSDDRLLSLAQYLMQNCDPPYLDIGGMDGQLARRMKPCPFDLSGPGDWITRWYNTIILSHTLEHVYSVRFMMEKIADHLEPGGQVVIEVPIWSADDDWREYDYHYQHIQKFTPGKLEELFIRHGFDIKLSEPLPRYREYNCHRLVATHGQ